MSISKYRSIGEVTPVAPLESPADNLRLVLDLVELCYGLWPVTPMRGIRRYRNVAAAAVAEGAPSG